MAGPQENLASCKAAEDFKNTNADLLASLDQAKKDELQDIEKNCVQDRSEVIESVKEGEKNKLFESVKGLGVTLSVTLKEYYNPASAKTAEGKRMYGTLYHAMSRLMIAEVEGRLTQKITELVDSGVSFDTAKDNVQAHALLETNQLDAELQKIAAHDSSEGGKISLLDIREEAKITSSMLSQISTLAAILDPDMSVSPEKVKEHIKETVMRMATTEIWATVGQQEGHASNPTERLKDELTFITKNVVGSKSMSAAEYEQMLQEITKELSSTNAGGHFGEAQDTIEGLLEMNEVYNEKTGEYNEVPRAVIEYRKDMEKWDIANVSEDASGTTFGKRANLTEISLYVLKDLAALGAIAQLMDPRLGGVPWQHALFFWGATEYLNPGVTNKFLGEPDYTPATVEQTRELGEFPGVESNVAIQLEDWAKAIDPKYFSADNKELTTWLKEQRIKGGRVDFNELANFLGGQSAEYEPGDPALDGIISTTSWHATAERMSVHDLSVIDDPQAQQALFNFLWSAAVEHHKEPRSLFN